MIEIERRFLVDKQEWPRGNRTIAISQGYLARRDGLVCRVRQKNEVFYLSIKARIDSVSSYDYEYPIPPEDGNVMLSTLCDRPPVSKTRHEVELDNLVWEIDEFHGANEGLIVAEIELPTADYQVQLPTWLSAEITDDERYSNASLYENPWTAWGKSSG